MALLIRRVRKEMYAHLTACEKCKDEELLDAEALCDDLRLLKEGLFKKFKFQKTKIARALLYGAFWNGSDKETVVAGLAPSINLAKAVISDTDTVYMNARWPVRKVFDNIIHVLDKQDNKNVTKLLCFCNFGTDEKTAIISALNYVPYLVEIRLHNIKAASDVQLPRELCTKLEECCPLLERIFMTGISEENVVKLPQLTGCTHLQYISYHLEEGFTVSWHPNRIINNIRRHEFFKLELPKNSTISLVESFECKFSSWVPRLSHVAVGFSTPGTIKKCFATFMGLYELHLDKCNAACLHVLMLQKNIQMRSLKIICTDVTLEVADLFHVFPNLEDIVVEVEPNNKSTITFTSLCCTKSGMKSLEIANTEPVKLIEILECLPLLKKLHVVSVCDTCDQLKELLATKKELQDLQIAELPNIRAETQEQLATNSTFTVCIGNYGKWCSPAM